MFCTFVPCPLLLQLKDEAKVAEYQPGQQLEITEMFKEGDNIDIAGTTVGKGFQGEQDTAGGQSITAADSGMQHSRDSTPVGELCTQECGEHPHCSPPVEQRTVLCRP